MAHCRPSREFSSRSSAGFLVWRSSVTQSRAAARFTARKRFFVAVMRSVKYPLFAGLFWEAHTNERVRSDAQQCVGLVAARASGVGGCLPSTVQPRYMRSICALSCAVAASAKLASPPSGVLSTQSSCSRDLQPLFATHDEITYVCDITTPWLHYSKASGSWAPATPPSGCHSYVGFSGDPPAGCLVGESCSACMEPDGVSVRTAKLHGGTCERCDTLQTDLAKSGIVSETVTPAPRTAPLGNSAAPNTRLPTFALGTAGLSSSFNSTLSWLRQGGRHIDTGECYVSIVPSGAIFSPSCANYRPDRPGIESRRHTTVEPKGRRSRHRRVGPRA